jgi:hypothetical protein
MCQQVFFCPEVLAIFRYVFPLLISLITFISILLTREIMQTYALLSRQQKMTEPQIIPTSYSLLSQAQEVVEIAEKQFIVEEQLIKEA